MTAGPEQAEALHRPFRDLKYEGRYPYTQALMRQAWRLRATEPDAAFARLARAEHYDALLTHYRLSGSSPAAATRAQLRQAVHTLGRQRQVGVYLFENAKYWVQADTGRGVITCEPFLGEPDLDLQAAVRSWVTAGWTVERYACAPGSDTEMIILISPPGFLDASRAAPCPAGP